MNRVLPAAIMAALLALAACNQVETSSRVGGESSSPGAAAIGTAGGVGAGNNSTHANGGTTGGATTGGATAGGGTGSTSSQ